MEIKREVGARGVRYKARVSWQEGKRQRQLRWARPSGGSEQENHRHRGLADDPSDG